MVAKGAAQVLVVGAGPVGLFAALELARQGVGVRIIDKDWRTGAHSYALALHPESLALLEPAGLLDRVLDQAYPVYTVGFYDPAGRRAEVRLATGDDRRSALAVLPQDVFEKLLEDALREAGTAVSWNHELAALAQGDRSATATVDKLNKDTVGYAVAHTEWVVERISELEVPFVIGADGHRSAVRRALEIDFPEVGPSQHFAVFEFKTGADLGHQMRVVLGEHTTDVLWPLPDGRCRWSFELPDFAAPAASRAKGRIGVQVGTAQYPVLAEENLRKLVAARASWFSGDVGEVQWRLLVRFERRLAGSFGRDRAWLAGDSGHITGPVGMQSMNAGLREAADLAGIVAGLVRGEAAADRLAAYGRDRTACWRRLLGLEGSPQPTGAADPWVAAHAERIAACLPAATREGMARLAGQVGLGWA